MLRPNTMLRHYNGGVYQFITTATLRSDHSEDLTVVAVYGDDRGDLHVRPVTEFFDIVTNADGESVARFEKVN